MPQSGLAAIEPAGELALETAAKRLAEAGAIVEELVLPEPFNRLHEAHTAIVDSEGGVSFLPEYVNAHALLAPDLKAKVENACRSRASNCWRPTRWRMPAGRCWTRCSVENWM